MIKEYGPKIFYKQILEEFESRSQAMTHEITLHNTFDVARSSEFFNRSKQTGVGFDGYGGSGGKGKKRPKQERIIYPHCGRTGGASGMRKFHFDKCPTVCTDEELRLQGRYPTQETKLKMRDSALGKVIAPSTILKRKNTMSLSPYKATEETKEKQSKSMKGKKHSERTRKLLSDRAKTRRKPTPEENRIRSERMLGVKQGPRKKKLEG
jgi:hypothetical protein